MILEVNRALDISGRVNFFSGGAGTPEKKIYKDT